MSTLVSTGQITIFDTNDARSVSVFLAANGSPTQIYSKDDDNISYLPSFATTNLTLTPQISIGGLTTDEAWASLTGKKFTNVVGGTELTSITSPGCFVNNSNTVITDPFAVTHAANGSVTPSTLVVLGNLSATTGNYNIFFEADFVDPVTTLVSHLVCQLTLTTVTAGTNAAFLVVRGKTAFERSHTTSKNTIAIAADLIRATTVDTTNLAYKWYEDGGGVQITTSLSGYGTKYSLNNSVAGTAPIPNGVMGQNIPNVGTGTPYSLGNNLTIHESAVAEMEVYKVSVTDETGKTYSAYFTVYDVSDPYQINVVSSTGDKLLNGVGTTSLTPEVFYGSQKLTSVDLANWTFSWMFYDANGNRGAFVDTSKIATPGATISANTAGTTAVFTHNGSYTFTAGQIIKVIKANGVACFYEVGSSTATTVTIRVPTTNTFLGYTAPLASEFVGGKLLGCLATRSSTGTAAITVTGYDIDGKGRIIVEGSRP